MRKIFNYESKILVQETIDKYGYLPESLGKSSRKFVVATCRFCGKLHDIRKGFFNKSGSACHKECKLQEQRKQASPFSKKEVRDKAKETNRQRYGVDYASQNENIAQKISETKKTQSSKKKTSDTNLERYGVENVFQSEEIKNKIKKTILEKYGVSHPMKNSKIKEKTKDTIKQRYGVDNVFQSKDVKSKIEKTNISKYGHSSPMKNKNIQKKAIATHKKKYGTDYPIQNKKTKEQIANTNFERYGVEYPSQNEIVKNKKRQTFSDTVKIDANSNFRLINILRGNEIWELMDEGFTLTNICEIFELNYGSLTFQLSTPEFKQKHQQRYSYPKNQMQNELAKHIKDINVKYINNDRKVIAPYEIDIFMPDKNIAIEFNGNYWHSEAVLPAKEARKKHINKTKMCEAEGVFLLHIFQNQWKNRKTQLLNLIKTKLGKNKIKIAGRKTTLSDDNASDFINDNHIQGHSRTTIKFFNLIYEGKIVACMTAAKHHRQNVGDNAIVLNRLCFADGVNVQGGSSKLFKYFKKWAKESGYSKIISWSDNCWTNGNIYKVLGFELEKEYGPDYFYWDKKNDCYVSKQSQRKSNTGCPKEITEREWSIQHGLYRIWDCGKKRWTYNL